MGLKLGPRKLAPENMPIKSKNTLTIEVSPDGNGGRLYGFLGGKKIRKKSADLAALEREKLKLETEYEEQRLAEEQRKKLQHTWLDHDQLRDAEAAHRELPKDRTLLACVRAGVLVLGSGKPVLCVDALNEWVENMTRRGLEWLTIRENKAQVKRFLKAYSRVKYLAEITPTITEDYCLRPGVSDYTRLTSARIMFTWLKFCVRQKHLGVIPMDLDRGELFRRAKPKTEPVIITPEESQRFINSACATGKPGIVVFAILSLQCFMRKSEVLALRPNMIREGSAIPDAKRRAGEEKLPWVHLKGKKIGSRWRDVPVPANVAPLFRAAIAAGAFDMEVCDETRPDYKKSARALKCSDWDFDHLRRDSDLLKAWKANVLRHTGMSYLFQETGDDDLVTTRAGNSERVAFMHYLRDAEPEAYKKFNAITAPIPAWNVTTQVEEKAVA